MQSAQDTLRWILIFVVIIQTVVMTAGESPFKMTRAQIGFCVFVNILTVLALLPNTN